MRQVWFGYMKATKLFGCPRDDVMTMNEVQQYHHSLNISLKYTHVKREESKHVTHNTVHGDVY